MNSYATNYKPSLARRLHLTDSYGLSGLGISLVIAGCTAVFVTVLVVSTISVSRTVGRTTCRNWSTQSGYPSKFVLLNYFDTGTCLALTPSGKWVPNSKVLTFTEGKRP